VRAVPSQPPEVDPKRLEAHVRHLSVDLYPRSHDQLRNIDLAAQYILAELKAAGGTVTVQDVAVQETKYRNIVARFGPPSGPLLVIGAHYDSHGDAHGGAKDPRGYAAETHTPGADDNASGVAGLLELAHLLGRATQGRPIELVAYTLEEPPHFDTEHMGSAWHARSLRAARQDVELMLSLEMIGYFSDEPGSQRYPVPGMSLLYSDRGDFVALVGKLSDFGAMRRVKAVMAGATNLPVYSINAPELLEGVDFSDHLNYWHEGYPAIMVTDTAFMRNPNYHLASDTYETLDYRRMAKVVQGVYAFTQQH
jgi:Zn-dependent M28 family amino/carboxypeptidase